MALIRPIPSNAVSSNKDVVNVFLGTSTVNAQYSFYDSANDTYTSGTSGTSKSGTQLSVNTGSTAGYPYTVTALVSGRYRIFNNDPSNNQNTGVSIVNANANDVLVSRSSGSYTLASVIVEAL